MVGSERDLDFYESRCGGVAATCVLHKGVEASGGMRAGGDARGKTEGLPGQCHDRSGGSSVSVNLDATPIQPGVGGCKEG